jgi:hypothetical protein
LNKLIPLLAFSILLLVPAGAQNAMALIMIDFEGLGLSEGDPVVSIPGVPEVTISGANLVVVSGGSPFCFNGDSQPGGNPAGGFDDASTGDSICASTALGTITIMFDDPVEDLTFDVLDVEIGSVTEIITSRVYDAKVGGNLLHTIIITGGDPGTGDGVATTVDFSSGFAGTNDIQRLEFEANDGGVAADNLFFNLVEVFEEVIGGEIIPIETTSLILAGAQSFSWMIPILLSGIGIGLFVVSRKPENS